MGRALSILFFILIVGYAFNIATTYNQKLVFDSVTQSALVIEEVDDILEDFNETGTLVFYPNNVGPVPYLFYQDQKGHTVAKALTFSNSSPVGFSSWSGAHVSVTGERNGEHVVVSNITFISAP